MFDVLNSEVKVIFKICFRSRNFWPTPGSEWTSMMVFVTPFVDLRFTISELYLDALRDGTHIAAGRGILNFAEYIINGPGGCSMVKTTKGRSGIEIHTGFSQFRNFSHHNGFALCRNPCYDENSCKSDECTWRLQISTARRA